MSDSHNWEADPRPLSDCLKAWHAQPHIGGRDNGADALGVPRSTYDGWCAGRRQPIDRMVRKHMTLIDKT